MDRSATESETKLGLALSAAERKLLDSMPVLNEGAIAAVPQKSKRTVQLSVDQLDDLADALSVKANHAEGRVLQRRLDTLVRKIDRLTGSHLRSVLEITTPVVQPAGSRKPKRNKPTLAVTLSPTQRETLKSVCTRKNLQQRLRGDGLQTIEFTHREIEYLHDRGRMQVASASTLRKKRLRSVCNKIGKMLGESQLVRRHKLQSIKESHLCLRQTSAT
jgi:hypothetical protein